ncbi:MAG: FtsQ-type POTRA domain-containing protein [Elainellaceae cyanobacterium]
MVRLKSSNLQIVKRRRQLRRRRRWRILRSLWQFLVVSAFTVGIVWTISLPGWVIRSPEQIVVSGNDFLSEETVQSLLPIDYPQSVLWVRPQRLAVALQSTGPIATASIKRHILPPGLRVHIQEQRPVALLMGPTDLEVASAQPLAPSPERSPEISSFQLTGLQPSGLLDEKGALIPIASYNTVRQDLALPDLKLIGMRQRYRSLWSSLYAQVERSPVGISEVDLRNPGNVVLRSDLGSIHIGGYDADRFAQQLKTLDRMRNLAQELPLDDLRYIDLTTSQPVLQMLESSVPVSDVTLDEEDSDTWDE